MTRLFLALALALLVAPAFAETPLPQMKPCVPIDDLNITDLERVVIIRLVAKSDYQPRKAARRKYQDRVPAGAETPMVKQ